ncbi:putative protein LIN-9/Protein ALWAYS EARLY [Lupinus albus]|uniref:Uncharacterized protein n=1 Tax=Lupinus albus TaxID=3870 RepID=A0A6A4QZP5_LUPAL|nr:putative protein LIN-9/Protein ALWAYS EARLY [Lupinus albus]
MSRAYLSLPEGTASVVGVIAMMTDHYNVLGGVSRCVAQAKVAKIDDHCVQQTVCAQPCTLTHFQAKEADIHALYELKRALDKKLLISFLKAKVDPFVFICEVPSSLETLLMELKSANADILENQNVIECLKDSESFKKHYAAVLVSDAMVHLRQHNTYTGNYLPPGMKPQSNFNDHNNLPSLLDSSLPQEFGSSVKEITKGSRQRANAMVDAAFQALSSIKDEDAFTRTGQALDSIDYQQLISNTRLPMIRSQEQVNGSSYHHNQSTICASVSPGPKMHNDSNEVHAKIPLELITPCIVTLIMTQTCTERQYPPADVVQMLDSAVTSLHPCSPQNLPIFREIQMCMGRIKTQVFSLVLLDFSFPLISFSRCI